jgi:serine/threonine protein phosphatase 1
LFRLAALRISVAEIPESHDQHAPFPVPAAVTASRRGCRPDGVLGGGPPGQRLYAIGDIHGRLDLFRTMIDRIDADDAARDPAETTVILLGDLVDRGPDSAGVIDAARAWGRQRRVRLVQGNHEEMFLGSFDDDKTLRHFLRYGGREPLPAIR